MNDYLNFLNDYNPPEQKEIVIDSRTGLPRQAGATMPEGKFIQKFKKKAEESLFVFSKGVMGRDYLTKNFHLPVANFLQKTPPFRKMLLMARDHAKTSIVSHCLPLHILVQPKENNIYFPGLSGKENRILLAGESSTRAESNLRVIASALESNAVFRSLWPDCTWEKPRRQAKKWSNQQLIIPREIDYPDPSIYAVGVGGAITGSRPTVIIKDDLISLEAANSEVVMRAAIDWHKASRALMDEYAKDTGIESLEFIIGTRWSVFDLYSYIIEGDDEIGPDLSVEVMIRRIIEDGKPAWPERFDEKRIDQLRREFGSMFYLLYMNEASDPSLVDFDISLIRRFSVSEDQIIFEADDRDIILSEAAKIKTFEAPRAPYGSNLNTPDVQNMLFGKGRGEYLRLKYK